MVSITTVLTLRLIMLNLRSTGHAPAKIGVCSRGYFEDIVLGIRPALANSLMIFLRSPSLAADRWKAAPA